MEDPLDRLLRDVDHAVCAYQRALAEDQADRLYDLLNRRYQALWHHLSPAYLSGCELYLGKDLPVEAFCGLLVLAKLQLDSQPE